MTDASPITARTASRSGCLVTRLVGVLDSVTYLWVRDHLIKLAMEQPDAVVAELDELHVESETLLTAFSSAWLRVNTWPGVPVLLVTTGDADRAWLRGAIRNFTPCYATVDAALAAARHPPAHQWADLDLEATVASSRVARAFVRHICTKWDIPERIPDALLVATELVDNATRHAGTAVRIRLELRPGMLTIAVRDGCPRPAVRREQWGDHCRGNGLRIVAGLARTWGCNPDLSGGKIVWAALT